MSRETNQLAAIISPSLAFWENFYSNYSQYHYHPSCPSFHIIQDDVTGVNSSQCCVWKWFEVDICFLSWHQLTGPLRWQPPQYSSIFWETSKSHQTNIVLHQLTFLWLTLFIRIKVKWAPATADLGKGCWLPPLWCCALWIYNGRHVSVIPCQERQKKHLPEP